MTPVAISESVSWLAGRGKGAVAEKARAIMALQPNDAGYRLRAALVDGFGWNFRRASASAKDWDRDFKQWLKDLVDELSKVYSDPETLRAEIEQALNDLQAVRASENSGYAIVGGLFNARPDFGEAVVDDAISRPLSPTAQYLGAALQGLMQREPERARALVRRLVKSNEPRQRAAAVSAYWGVEANAEDIEFFQTILASGDRAMVYEGLRVLRRLGVTHREKIELTKAISFGEDASIADEIAVLWRDIGGEGAAEVGEGDAEHFLNEALTLPKLKGHWLGEILATFPNVFRSRRSSS